MLNTEWQLNGKMADRYEEFLVPVIFQPWAHDLLARSQLRAGDTLLDLACGTGIVARTASKMGINATGGDINEDMLSVARDRAPEIDFRHADAQALPFGDGSFDAIICQQGLQFFPDKPAAAAECRRALNPGGRAIFCTARTLDENPLMSAQVSAIGDALGEDAAAPIRAVCRFHDTDETRQLFSDAGFGKVAVEQVALKLHAPDARAFVEGLMKSTPVAGEIATMSPPDRDALRDAILKGFGECFDGASLTFPHSANVVCAER